MTRTSQMEFFVQPNTSHSVTKLNAARKWPSAGSLAQIALVIM